MDLSLILTRDVFGLQDLFGLGFRVDYLRLELHKEHIARSRRYLEDVTMLGPYAYKQNPRQLVEIVV